MIKTFISRPTWVPKHIAKHLQLLDEKLESMGFEAKTVGTNVTSFASPFEEVFELIDKCDCAIILGIPQILVNSGKIKGKEIEKGFSLSSEWNQIEATIALTFGKPTLMMLHNGVAPNGLFAPGAANVFIHKFHSIGPRWVENTVTKLKDLKEKVEA